MKLTKDINVEFIKGKVFINMEKCIPVIISAKDKFRKGIEFKLCDRCDLFKPMIMSINNKDYCESCANEILKIKTNVNNTQSKQKYARKCSKCGKVFNEGFIDGEEYYCSEKCLPYTKKEWKALYSEYPDYCYWTVWEDEEDFQYYEDGTEVEE